MLVIAGITYIDNGVRSLADLFVLDETIRHVLLGITVWLHAVRRLLRGHVYSWDRRGFHDS
jgi:hypothetical protein